MKLIAKFYETLPSGERRYLFSAKTVDGQVALEDAGGRFSEILEMSVWGTDGEKLKPQDGDEYLRALPANFRTSNLYAELEESEEGDEKPAPEPEAPEEPAEEFDPEELSMGEKVEMEHTDDPEEARKIAQDHLREHPDYYSRLKETGLAEELEPGVTKAVADLREFYRARAESVYGEVVRAAQTAGYSQIVAKSMGDEARARVKNEYVEALNAAIESGRARLAQIRNGR